MRIAVISDVHGNLPALEAVLADLAGRAPDLTVNLGDCASSPLWPSETMALLETHRFPTVRGNHDRWVAELDVEAMSPTDRYTHDALSSVQRSSLGGLPTSLALDDGRVLAVHGTPASDTHYLLEDAAGSRLALATARQLDERLGDTAATLVLCGHSHNQRMARSDRGRTVLNPGSVGCPRYADNPSPWTNEAGSPHARYALATRRGARWEIESVALVYDWEAAAERAGMNGRPDWAEALR